MKFFFYLLVHNLLMPTSCIIYSDMYNNLAKLALASSDGSSLDLYV